MDVGCSQWGFEASTMTPQHHTGLAIPHFPENSTPPAHILPHKDAPICPSTASHGVKTLCKHPICMWDAVNGGLQPQPWHHYIIQARPYHTFPENPTPPAHVMVQHKSAPICPSTASQGAKTLFIHPKWLWDAANGGLKPLQWHHNIIQARPYPISPKTQPHLHTYYSIRMYPYAHPQHLKVLRHFLYIQNGCRIREEVVAT